MRYKYKLKTLTPIHIGSGDKIFPLEYVLDDKLYRIDMDKLFTDGEFNREEFIKKSTMGFFYLGDFQPDIAKKYRQYEIVISSSAYKSLDKQIKQKSPNTQIREFIKSGDSPFIPGTTIKGAIRTAILWQALQNPNTLHKAEEILVTQMRKQERSDPKRADEEIEKYILGKDPNHDLLRALQVTDTNLMPVQSLQIYEIKTLTTLPQGHNWKGFITFAEGFFSEQTKLEGEIKINHWLLYGRHPKGENKEIPAHLKFINKQTLIQNIPKICNDFAKNLIDNELKFYRQYNSPLELNSVINRYEQLKSELKNLKDKEFLLHFAWGTGWRSMTIGRILQETSGCYDEKKCYAKEFCRFHDTVFCRLRRNYNLGAKRVRRNQPLGFYKEFPKTRKIIFENNKPANIFGWVRLSLEEVR